MSGALQAVFQNQRSFFTGPAIGSALEGGFYAGQIGSGGIATHNLIIGPISSAQSTLQYKTSDTSGDPSSVINGPANSSTMNDAAHPAAQFCEGLTIGGFSDWYMPAKNELEVCYYNLKPTTTSNNTSKGANTNAIPSRPSNYTSGDPAQTSATDFKSGGTEAFAAAYYWSSSQYFSFAYAWAQTFSYGYQSYASANKSTARRVRAVRRVAV
jgi:hypothetical protein